MRRGAICVLLLAAGCRQMLDLEPARLEPLPGDGGGDAPTSGGGSTASPAGGGGSGSETVNEAGEAGDDSEPNHATGGTPATPSVGGDAGSEPVDVGGGGSAPELSACEQYCGAMEANCTGDLVQYSDYETCLDTCALLPLGQSGDSEVNSVYCRLAEAEKAGRLEPEFYCPLAGPASAGKCGTSCDAYCDIMMGFCTSEATSGLYFYADKETCLGECAFLPLAGEPYSAALHSIGPHFECRMFHACASNVDAEYHCGHAFGDPPCNPL
jgi:hypothetical protein